jgi:hypothetical protein
LLKAVPESGAEPEPTPAPEPLPPGGPGPCPAPVPEPEPTPGAGTRTFRISGEVPPEIWNRLGTKVLPKLRSGTDLKIGIEFSVTVEKAFVTAFESDLRQILNDLSLSDKVTIE